MLLKAINPDGDQYNAKTQDRSAVKEALKPRVYVCSNIDLEVCK